MEETHARDNRREDAGTEDNRREDAGAEDSRRRDIPREIQENLDEIEAWHGVRILLAVESGSRSWGFASPDSDYDVRFIYLRPRKDYLRIDPPRDVIEWRLDEVLDINGWDLKKALSAFGKGNVSAMEWAGSPIIYRKAPEWDHIWKVSRSFFSEKAALIHYYGVARSTLEHDLTGETVRYKKYFYALRPLLCCRWIERYHEMPPVPFETLLTLFDGGGKRTDGAGRADGSALSPRLLEGIRELLARKAVTEEKESNPHMPVIIDFIREECDRQKLLSAAAPEDRSKDYSPLNAVFRKTLDVMER